MGPGRTIPQASKDELVKVAQEFADRLDELYGFHLDIVSGFKANLYRFNKDQPDPPGSDPAELDQRGMTIGRGNPNDPDNVILHQTTHGQYRARNDTGGLNYRLASHNFIVFVFHLWDQEYRPRIAKLLGRDVKELKVPIMGDLRHLRNEVLKHHGVLTEWTQKRLEAIGGLEVGKVINFADDDIEQLVRRIKAELDAIVLSATGIDPKFRTLWHVK